MGRNKRLLLFSYLCHCGVLFHHISTCKRIFLNVQILSSFIRFIYLFISLFSLSLFPVFLSFLRSDAPSCLHDHSEPYLLIFLQKCIPRFPMHVNTVLINRFHTAVVLARWGAKGIPTSQETHCVPATKPNRLMLFREIIAVYCENRMEHINTQ
jgi:hypothetical protein